MTRAAELPSSFDIRKTVQEAVDDFKASHRNDVVVDFGNKWIPKLVDGEGDVLRKTFKNLMLAVAQYSSIANGNLKVALSCSRDAIDKKLAKFKLELSWQNRPPSSSSVNSFTMQNESREEAAKLKVFVDQVQQTYKGDTKRRMNSDVTYGRSTRSASLYFPLEISKQKVEVTL